ncbi:hypothetical protein [Streptomyces sp. NPDC058092]|uniref:hypothetical protein n=1 Tax=Streptomyces sp. NPDC058092 TaxID=3346336 RepID=UPI0036ED1080
MTRPTLVAARLPGGRLLIASLDPNVPEHHSPLRQALRTAPHLQADDPRGNRGRSSPDKPPPMRHD